jgi:hypothetical protein
MLQQYGQQATLRNGRGCFNHNVVPLLFFFVRRWTIFAGLAVSAYGTLVQYVRVASTRLRSLGQIQRVMDSGEKFFAVKWLNEKGNYTDLHRGDPRGAIFASRDHDHMGLRRNSA